MRLVHEGCRRYLCFLRTGWQKHGHGEISGLVTPATALKNRQWVETQLFAADARFTPRFSAAYSPNF
jgi:hypothetical protein